MEQKICLDTDVVIAILNNEDRAIQVINKIEEGIVFVTAITIFELFLRKTNLEALETFRNKVHVIEFDEESARKSSQIFKELQKKGRITDFRDIFIASICITNKCSLATFNKKHFEPIPEINLV